MKKTILCPKCEGRGYQTDHYFDTSGVAGVSTSPCPLCNGTQTIEVPMTNFDHIKTMGGVDEMAEFLSNTFCHGYGKKQLEEWLKSEVQDDG